MREYPAQVDCVWLASDRVGQMAAFITAGEGPIPRVLLDHDEFDIEAIEPLIIDLPRVGGVQLLVSVPRPDDFIAMAERGIFVYDWTDIHRASDFLRAYELVAIPLSPINETVLPEKLLNILGCVRFRNLEFSRSGRLDVGAHFAYEQGRY
jgi:hypothetical protein